MDWPLIIANLINMVLVLMGVQVLKNYVIPWLKANFPWVLPILAGSMGAFLQLVTDALMVWLGHPIDLSPIGGLFTGFMAVAAYDILEGFTVVKGGKFPKVRR